jgi:DNA-binding transcriptional MerR regulator
VYSRVQMQLFKAKQAAQREVDKALEDVGMTLDEVRAYLAKHPELNHAFHKSPHKSGSTTADLIYDVGARRKKLAFWKSRLVETVTRSEQKAEHAAHEHVLAVARRAAAKTRKKNSIVQVAPELDEGAAIDARPPIPAGRKSLTVIN